MTTTPTFWGNEVIISNDTFAYGTRVTALQDGTFILAWENGTDIFARQLSELGSFTGGDFLSTVSSDSGKPLGLPIITQQIDGRVVVNYRLQFDDSPQDYDVLWHSPASDFTPHGSVFGTENSSHDEILMDSAARTGGGGAILYSYDSAGTDYMVLRFTDSIGQQASNQIFIDSSATRLEQNGAIAGLHTGFVAYESVLQSGSFPRDVRLQVFTPAEQKVGDVVVSASNVNAAFPDVIELTDGTFVVTWQQNDGISFRRYSGNGVAVDADPVHVASSAAGILPKITALKDGGFMLGWVAASGTESDASPDMDMFLQRFDNSGTAIGNQIHLDKAGDQGLFSMDLATLSDGRVVLTYQSETGDATDLTTLDYQIFDPREKTILATNGDDNFVSREDGAKIQGLDGNDKLTGRAGKDQLIGGADDDMLLGAGGADNLRGGTGDDTVQGGAGADLVVGGLGADQLSGGLQAVPVSDGN